MPTSRRRQRSRRTFILASLLMLSAATFTGFAAAGDTGNAPGQAPPSIKSLPLIEGNTVEGQTLSASEGEWSGASLSHSFQWNRCSSDGSGCNPISGATGSRYQLAAADVGAAMRATVTAVNKRGSSSATSAPSAVIQASPVPLPPAQTTPPANTGLPQIVGTAQVGVAASSNPGAWSGSPTAYAHQWKRCDAAGEACSSISGATATAYTPVASDAGATLRISVAATNAGGTTIAQSPPSSPIAAAAVAAPVPSAAPANTTLPQVTGSAQAGQTLSSSTGTWSGSPTSYAYQWKRCDASGANCVNIVGSTAAAHTATAGDVGQTLRVSVSASNSTGTGVALSVQTAAVAAAPAVAVSSRFGIATGGDIQNWNSTVLTQYFDKLKAAGVGWVRFPINWDVIQHSGPTSYNWAPFDNVVNAASARGMKVLGIITYTPSWARAAGTSAYHPPTNNNDFATFARAAVAHYAPMGVRTWEVWNEPNISVFWQPAPDPSRYTQLLKLAYSAIKGVDPSAFVVSAGLSPYGQYGQTDSRNMNPLTYLERMYAAGARGSFDAVGWHPYNFGQNWTADFMLSHQVWSAWSQMSETSPSVRSIMGANGDGAKQVWATEFGAATGSSSRSTSEAEQAKYVTAAYAKLKTWSWAGPAFFHSGRDQGSDQTNVENAFGIIRFDWSAKPAYNAFQASAAAG